MDWLSHHHARRAAYAWLAAGLLWFVLEGVAAAAVPGYSYLRDYISQLGADGSPLHALMDFNYFAHGALFLAGAVLASRACATATGRRPSIGVMVFVGAVAVHALGIWLVGTFHGSAPITAAQLRYHGLGALLAIVFGNVAIITGGIVAWRLGAPGPYRAAWLLLATVGVVSILLSSHAVFPIGLLERGSVYPIMAWEILSGAAILLHLRRAPA